MKTEDKERRTFVICLQGRDENEWVAHSYPDEKALRKELAQRNIRLGKGVTIERFAGIGNHSVIGDGCRLGEECMVGPGCVLGRVSVGQRSCIGADSVIEDGAVLKEDAFVGETVHIQKNCTIGERSEIGRNTRITVGCRLDHDCIVQQNVYIGNGAVVKNRAYVGPGCSLGFWSEVQESARLGRDVQVGDYTTVWPEQRVNSFSTIRNGEVMRDQQRFDRTVKRMEKSLEFAEVGMYSTVEGVNCIRARLKGETSWLGGERISPEDSEQYRQGRMTMRSLAAKYFTPTVMERDNRRHMGMSL